MQRIRSLCRGIVLDRKSRRAFVLPLILFACGRNPSGTAVRLAIVPANVLIANASSQWMSLGVALALEQDLVTSRLYAAVLVTGESNAYQRGSKQILRTTVESRNGRVSIEAEIIDLATQRGRGVIRVEEPCSAGALAAVNALAKRIDPQAADFSTKSSRAWQVYTAAAESTDPHTRVEMLNTAIGDDPAFGLAYLVLAEIAGQNGSPNAGAVISDAAKHRDAFSPLDRARFDAMVSRSSHAPLAKQAAATAEVLHVAPNDVDATTTLGSMRFLEGNARDGERLMNRALALNPGSTHIRAQLAEGLIETRHFAEAEKLFTNLGDNLTMLPQAGIAALLEGNDARANTMFSDYLKQRAAANDPLLFLTEANWIAISKRPSAGAQFLAKNNLPQDDLRSLALSQSSVWELMDKDSTRATRDAAAALHLAKAPVPKLFGTVAVLVADVRAEPRQWRERVNAAPLQDSIKRAILAYGLFLNGRYAEAVPEWQKLVMDSGDADLRARAMLAASLDRAGRSAEARNVGVEPFAPNLTGADQFAVLTFDEMRRLLNLPLH